MHSNLNYVVSLDNKPAYVRTGARRHVRSPESKLVLSWTERGKGQQTEHVVETTP
jgi:hypothetical protein